MRLHRFRGKGAKGVRAFGFTGAIVLTGGLAFRIVEPDSTTNLEDALWWSLVTLSTVGYGDITPTSTGGHLVAACIIIAGIGVFGYLAGFMASLLVSSDEQHMLRTLERIEEQLAELQRVSQPPLVPSVNDREDPREFVREPARSAAPRALVAHIFGAATTSK